MDGKASGAPPRWHARIVARLRERGHKLEHIKKAGEEGRLAYGYIEELFGGDEPGRSLKEAAELTTSSRR